MKSVFDLASFGATGISSVDITARLQDAVDAAGAAGGGTVWVPAGSFAISAQITMDTDKVEVVGASRGGSKIRNLTSSKKVFVVTGADCAVRNILIDCESTGDGGVDSSGATRYRENDVRVINSVTSTNNRTGEGSNFNTLEQLRSDFISRVLGIVKDSTGATPMLWVPNGTDTTTSTTDDENQATITHTGGSLATRYSRLGLGYAVSFDGSTQYSTIPDADRYSFGTGTADSAFSILALVNVTNTALDRTILSKWLASNHEYRFYVTSLDILDFQIEDESAAVIAHAASSAAVNQGTWVLFGSTYDGTGGSTAAGGMTSYQNGASIAVTATNNASYVAMENKAANLAIGSASAAAASLPFQGKIAGLMEVNKELTAGDMWQLYQAFLGYYDFLA